MLKIDSTLTMTAVIALSAVFAPVITKLIDKHYELKCRKFDLFYSEKNTCYKEFCNKAAVLVANHCSYGKDYSLYLIAYGNAYLCASSSTRSKIDKVHNFINSHLGPEAVSQKDKEFFESVLNSLVEVMGKDLGHYRK